MTSTSQMDTGDGRIFVWIHTVQAWSPPALTPQIVRDVKMFDHSASQLCNKGRICIVKRVVLDPGEYGMTIEQLAERYPAPNDWTAP